MEFNLVKTTDIKALCEHVSNYGPQRSSQSVSQSQSMQQSQVQSANTSPQKMRGTEHNGGATEDVEMKDNDAAQDIQEQVKVPQGMSAEMKTVYLKVLQLSDDEIAKMTPAQRE